MVENLVKKRALKIEASPSEVEHSSQKFFKLETMLTVLCNGWISLLNWGWTDAHNHRILWIHLFFKTYSDLCIFEFFDNMMDCSHLYFEGGVNKRIIPIVNYWV